MEMSNIVIGKFTLESLTNGMYASSMDLFREYVQNSVDSIDNAVKNNLIENNEAKIDILVDSHNKYIKIEDNGQGIKSEIAVKLLLDIGNSSKNRSNNRGFRGIGRLAGLGYCNKLIFTTSYRGEKKKSIISFDAKLLKELLRSTNDKNESITDIIKAITRVSYAQEKENNHYFSVELVDVDDSDELLDCSIVRAYLIQNLPLRFQDTFYWGDVITKKILREGYSIPSYNVSFSDGMQTTELRKSYENSFMSDRVKRFEKSIDDVEVLPFYDGTELVAILWYAKTDYSGTILNEVIKGIRVRQGNILIGNRATGNQYFKEERFNGWLIGELYIVDNGLVPNARRDDFENTIEYINLKGKLLEWSNSVSKEIRKISYERSISAEKKKTVEESFEADENNLIFEDVSFNGEVDEINDSLDESSIVANSELIDKFKILLGQKDGISKYKVLNLCNEIPNDQKKMLENVFDILHKIYPRKKAENIVNDIVSNFRM